MSSFQSPVLFPVNRPEVRGGEVESIVWPSDNAEGIPTLDLSMQAEHLPGPALTWGSCPRTTINYGSWLFYTQDYRYTALWSDPKPIVNSQCQVAAEPNFSCYRDTPYVVALWRIYQKRWLARWWQSKGIRVLVDLNVARNFAELNLLGVPEGWRAYATRGCLYRFEETEAEYLMACNHAQTSDILFIVSGGSRKLEAICQERGWIWVPEQQDVAKKRAKAYVV